MSHRNMSRVWVLLVAAFVIAAIFSRRAAADTVISLGSLQDLINLGSTGITVGNVKYSDFTYMGSPPPGQTGLAGINPAPTASHIGVGAFQGGDPGLTFTTIWESAEGFNQDSVIRYDVHVINGGIDRVGLAFDGETPAPGLLTNASVTETVAMLDGNAIGQTSTFNDGTGRSFDRLQSSLNLPKPMRDLFITKDVAVHTPVGLGGVATVSFVDNRYHIVAVPLPSSAWGGLGLCGLMAVFEWRRRKLA